MSTVAPLSRRTERVPLFEPADQARLAELAQEAARAIEASGPQRVGDGTPAREAAEQYDALHAEALERARWIELEALPRKAWRALLMEHPARMIERTTKDADGTETSTETAHEDDAAVGFNVESIAEPLVQASIKAGQFDSLGDRDAFLDDLSEPNFARLFGAAVLLNRQDITPPKAGLVSLLAAISDETSNLPGRLA